MIYLSNNELFVEVFLLFFWFFEKSCQTGFYSSRIGGPVLTFGAPNRFKGGTRSVFQGAFIPPLKGAGG